MGHIFVLVLAHSLEESKDNVNKDLSWGATCSHGLNFLRILENFKSFGNSRYDSSGIEKRQSLTSDVIS